MSFFGYAASSAFVGTPSIVVVEHGPAGTCQHGGMVLHFATGRVGAGCA